MSNKGNLDEGEGEGSDVQLLLNGALDEAALGIPPGSRKFAAGSKDWPKNNWQRGKEDLRRKGKHCKEMFEQNF